MSQGRPKFVRKNSSLAGNGTKTSSGTALLGVPNVPTSPTETIVCPAKAKYDQWKKGRFPSGWGKTLTFMTQLSPGKSRFSRPPQNFEREESQLWRWILLFMV